ncbi:MAG: prepilin-type N-terminal cleavage/methylation domain-containing protein [Gammaproteobacteria bacterium]|jgi:type IV pilus assembly protein PilE|nr:prepilin-type N-terminal cleavage/methylation domain-containing protein [Gammaproteobacteria bacterium]
MRYASRCSSGFTLIELLVVLSIVGVLAAIALPSYQNYIEKSRRSDAMSSLLKLQLEQERYRANHTSYGELSDVWSGSDSLDGYYQLAVSGVSASGYTASATPKSNGKQAGDSCTFSLDQDGPDVSSDTKKRCWNK